MWNIVSSQLQCVSDIQILYRVGQKSRTVCCFLVDLCVSEREDVVHQIKGSNDQQLQKDLTKLLNGLIARMEVKGEQIVKLKRCQDLVTVHLLLLCD